MNKRIIELLKKELKKETYLSKTENLDKLAKQYEQVGIILWDSEMGDTQMVWLKDFEGVCAMDLYSDVIALTKDKFCERDYLADYDKIIEGDN